VYVEFSSPAIVRCHWLTFVFNLVPMAFHLFLLFNLMGLPLIFISFPCQHYGLFFVGMQYVRPGAAPMPAATSVGPGGTPGQVRPMNMGAMAGRGRGDWRPVGIKGAPQKNFHPGFGGSAWGAGRGFGSGMEFTLPSHK
jgi:hypothetical protein